MAKKKKDDEAAGPGAVGALELAGWLSKQPAPPSLVVILGEEPFLRDEAREALTRDLPPTALTEVEGKKTELPPVLDELRTLPFLGDRRVVVVRDAGEFAVEHADALGAFFDEKPVCTLVLETPKLDRRRNVVKALLARALVVACDPPEASGLRSFIVGRAKKWGRELGRGAAEALLERLGGHSVSLATLDAEMRKLAAAGQGPITPEEVEALCTVGSSEESFAVVDGVAKGDVGRTLERLQVILRDGLVANGERVREAQAVAFMLLGLLRWDLGRLLRARAMLDDGAGPRDVTESLRVWRDKERFIQRVQRSTRESLAWRHGLLREADAAMKSSADPINTLTMLLVRLARSERPGR